MVTRYLSTNFSFVRLILKLLSSNEFVNFLEFFFFFLEIYAFDYLSTRRVNVRLDEIKKIW